MEGFPTFNGSWPWPWIGSHCIPSCITHRPLPTCQISLWTDRRIHGTCPCGRVLTHSASMCSRAWRIQWPGFDSAQAHPPTKELFLIIYAHDEQGANPGQVRGFDGILYKLWPLLMPWLEGSRYELRWRESRSRQMWLSLLTDAKEVSIRWPGA